MLSKYEKYLLKKQDVSRITFDLYHSKMELGKLLNRLPEKSEVYKMISPAGGWSSCSLILWLAAQTKIKHLFITTLRFGKKELDALVALKRNGTIKNIDIVLCGIAKENKVRGKDYEYSRYFESICDKNLIRYRYARNHSKIILIDADEGKFTIETSSNFNENPKIEQFSFEKSDELYNFYACIFKELIGGDLFGQTERAN